MKRWTKKLRAGLVILGFIAFWEAVTRGGLVNTMLLPPFSEVLRAVVTLFRDQNMLMHISLSLERSLGGLLIAITVAVPLGVVMSGFSERLCLAVTPLVEVLCQLNPFVLYHLVLLFLGVGETTKITIIAWTCIWPLLFGTIGGIGSIAPIHIKSAKAFGLNRWQMTVKILIPGAVPQILYGARMSLNYSLFMLIAAEMMGGSSGLGYLIMLSQRSYQITWVFALVLMIAVLGMLLDLALKPIEKKLLHPYLQGEVHGSL